MVSTSLVETDAFSTSEVETPERDHYILDVRSTDGNELVWWCERSKGYTADIRQAGRYTRAEAMRQRESRVTDFPVPVTKAQQCVSHVVWRDKLLDHMVIPYKNGRMPGDPPQKPVVDVLYRMEHSQGVTWHGTTSDGRGVTIEYNEFTEELHAYYGCDTCGDEILRQYNLVEPTVTALAAMFYDHFTLPADETEA